MKALIANKSPLPEAQDWNQFWGLKKTQQFTKISWSKKRIVEILKPYVLKGNHALDAGCGSGYFAKFFCDQGMSTVALDFSEKALLIAGQMTGGRVRLVQQSLLADHLDSKIQERFDLIFTDGLLEHFIPQDQNRIIQNLRLVLSPQGTIVTFVPNKWSPWELIRPFFMPGIEETPFVLKGLVDLHERNGLKIVGQGGINTLPFVFSPDRLFGSYFGMLLFVIAKNDE